MRENTCTTSPRADNCTPNPSELQRPTSAALCPGVDSDASETIIVESATVARPYGGDPGLSGAESSATHTHGSAPSLLVRSSHAVRGAPMSGSCTVTARASGAGGASGALSAGAFSAGAFAAGRGRAGLRARKLGCRVREGPPRGVRGQRAQQGPSGRPRGGDLHGALVRACVARALAHLWQSAAVVAARRAFGAACRA